MGFVIKSSIVAFHFVLYEYRFFDLMSSMPIWLLWVLTFILIDLVFYIYHRMSHRVRFLWTVHMSHHSSEEMNFAVSFRQAWFGPISKIPFFMVLPILGLDPLMIAVAGVVSTLWGVVGHTQIIGKLGPLEWVFNTPSHHRVHHGSNPEYIDKNYGNLFIIWDRIFGTFEPENKPVEYGLVNNVNTFNPIKITFMGWEKLFKDIRNSESFKETIGLIFGPPETHSKET
jgi:sterol desaturase/sphingolipid hydroxylase (fatty acid hydroxylase superfamily)